MSKAVDNTINYLQAPENYFWRWSDEGRIIVEWTADRNTICYSEDLFSLLKQMQTTGLPRIGPVLLVLHACHHSFGTREKFALLKILNKYVDRDIERRLGAVSILLNNIYALPIELRTGQKRVQLLNELFKASTVALGREDFTAMIGELEAEQWTSEILQPGKTASVTHLRTDLACLLAIQQAYPTVEKLELLLRTGLDQVPEPLEIPFTRPETTSIDLFDQLLEDPKTVGISRIARKLLPVIHIPMHSLAAGDQPIGGISDITNRGNYDKLLLSELAQDELLLTARLVNNEALYFRREEPPQHPKRRKIILIDSTIKMWGIPRVYAIAAALAFTRNSRHGEEVEAFILGGRQFEKVSLTSRAGVITALEQMHHGLHAGPALEHAISTLDDKGTNEFVLITEERQLLNPSFYASFSKVREQVSFLIALNRTGHISFSEFVQGRSKLLNEAKLDLVELFLPPEKKEINVVFRDKKISNAPLKFLTYKMLPLCLIKKRIQLHVSPMAASPDGSGMVVINSAQRVLFLWPKRGATEMLPFIEHGKYTISWTTEYLCYILVCGPGIVKLYKFDLLMSVVHHADLSKEIESVNHVIFSENGLLYIFSFGGYLLYNCERMSLVKNNWADDTHRKQLYAGINALTTKEVTKETFSVFMTSPAFQSVTKFDRVYISSDRQLVLGRSTFHCSNNNLWLVFNNHTRVEKVASPSKENYFKGTKCKHRVWLWADGSEAIVDKRGILHLRSSNENLPEVAIILAGGIALAGWASTDEVCGNDYFINPNWKGNIIDPSAFLSKYIQPFIHHIFDHAAKP